MADSKNTQTEQLLETTVSGSFFNKTFRKIPIIIYKDIDDGIKHWRCELPDDYPNYKPKKYNEINFEDLDFHFHFSKGVGEPDAYPGYFSRRKDAVLAAKDVIKNTNFNFKIWFL